MKEAYEVMYSQMKRTGDYNKRYYDKKARCVDIEVGDHVLLRNVGKDEAGKIRSHWEQQLWLVVERERCSCLYSKGCSVERKQRRYIEIY